MFYIFLVCLAAAGWLVIDAIRVYRKTPGTSWFTAFHSSAVLALSRLGAFGSVIIAGIVSLSSYLGDPQMADAIKQALGAINPAIVPLLPIIFLALAEWARRRTLHKEDKS